MPSRSAPVITETNIVVLDPAKNVIARLDVAVGEHVIGHDVEIHHRIGRGAETKIGVDHYQCSSVKCNIVSADKIELPTQVIENRNTSTDTDTNINPGGPNR